MCPKRRENISSNCESTTAALGTAGQRRGRGERRAGNQNLQPDPIEPVVIDQPPLVKPPSPIRPKAVASVGDNDGKPFKVGDKIILDGSKSVAAEADTPHFVWKQLDTTADTFVRALTPVITQPFSTKRSDKSNFPVQSFIATANGVYKFELQMEIGADVVESDPVTFQVGMGNEKVANGGTDPVVPPPNESKAPVVRLAASKNEAVGDEITLDGSKSTSGGGAPLTFI